MNSIDLQFIGDEVYDIATAVAFLFMHRIYFHIFFERKKPSRLAGAVEAAYFISALLVLEVTSASPPWVRLLANIGTTVLFSFSVVGSLLKRTVFSLIYQVIYMSSELLMVFFLIMLHIDWVVQDIAGPVSAQILMLILLRVLQCIFQKDMKELPWKYHLMMMSLPIGSMIISYHLFLLSIRIDEVRYVYMSFLIVVAMLLINVVMFWGYRKLVDNLEVKRENAIYQLELDLYGTHIKEKESAMMEIRQVRHDLKNQLIFLLELSEKKEYGQLEDYLKRMVDWEPLEGLMVARTDHFMIDALVNYKYSFAKSRGIAFRAKMDLPTSLPFEDDDLCIILGNALDNGIEAALRGEVETPYVDLNMKYDSGNLIVIIENSFDGEIRKDRRGRMLTRKPESENHGIGIDSMKKAAQKYHGFFDMEHDSGKFCLKFILYSEE